MTQLLYKYDKCLECGHEGFQWGIEIFYRGQLQDEHIFICHTCIKTIDNKLTDLEEGAKHKPNITEDIRKMRHNIRRLY